MAIESWDEFRTAFEVARVGTISGAAESLGMHRATIMRHIDALEAHLGAKVFHRHPQGYTPTELGAELINAGTRASEVISQFVGMCQLQNARVDGNLVIAAPVLFGPVLLPAVKLFQDRHPLVRIQLKATDVEPRLEHGEAHIFFAVGKKPDSPDNVVQPFLTFASGVFAASDYVSQYGKPSGVEDLAGHRYVVISESFGSSKPTHWLRERIRPEDVVLEADTPIMAFRAVLEGIGIGVMPEVLARGEDIQAILEHTARFDVPSWTVTHVDIHRTPKLRAFIECLRDINAMGKHARDANARSVLAV